MKKIVVLTAFCFCAFTVIGQTVKPNSRKDSTDKYCAKLQNGRLIVMHNAKQLDHDTTFANGAVLKTDGTVIKLNGNENLMKNGECVDHNGEIIPLIGKVAREEGIKKDE